MAEEINEYVKKRIKEGAASDNIEIELKQNGYSEREIIKAMDFDDYPETKKNHTPILIVILIVSVVGGLIWIGPSRAIPLIILFAKAILYSVIMYILFVMDSTDIRFQECFTAGMLIAATTLIPQPIVKYTVLIFLTFLMTIGYKSGSFKIYAVFVIFLIVAEISIGIILPTFVEDRSDDFCSINKPSDIYSKGNVVTNSGNLFDQCLNNNTPVYSCKNCILKEYRCLFLQLSYDLIECNCTNGACK